MGCKEACRDHWGRYRPDIVSRLPSLRLRLTPSVLGAGLGTGHWAVGVVCVCVIACPALPVLTVLSLSFPPFRTGLGCLLPTGCHLIATNTRKPYHVKDEGVVQVQVSERMVRDNMAGL